jgi:predicted DNA-binding protein
MPAVQPKRTDISVRASTYERLRAAAAKTGEQVGTLTDAIITRYLDELERSRGR